MKTSELLEKAAKPKFFIPCFILGFALQGVLLGIINPKILAITGGVKPLDLQMGFSWEYASMFAESLGSDGHNIYVRRFILVDWFYTSFSGLAFTLFLTWLYKRAFTHRANLHKFGITPLFVILFDYLENIFSVAFVQNYPDNVMLLAKLSSLSGVLKMMFFYLTLLQVIGLLIILLVKKVRPAIQ